MCAIGMSCCLYGVYIVAAIFTSVDELAIWSVVEIVLFTKVCGAQKIGTGYEPRFYLWYSARVDG